MEKGRFPVLFLILLLFFAISVSATPLDPSQQTYVNSGLPDSDRYFPDHRLYLGLFVEPDYYESITLADFNIDAVLPKLTEKDRIYLVIELMESPGAADTNFNVHLIEQAWRDTSATWNSISPALGSSVAQGTLMRGTGTYRIDLTGSLRGLSSFNGIALKTTDSGVYNNKKIRVSLDIVLGANECQLQGGDCKSNCAAGEEEINDGFLGCGFFNPLTKCCKEIEIEQPPEALPPPVINNECRNRGGVGGDEPEEETYGCYIRRPCETLKRPAIDDDGYCNNLYGLPGIRVYCCGPTEAERLAPPSAAPPVPRVAPSLPIREVPPVAVAADACNDSDGGMNIYIKGAVTIPKGTSEDACQIYGQGAFVDVCGENCAIHEEYCKDGVRNATQIRCPNGCKDGACIQAAQPTSTNYIYANGQRIAKIENNQTFYFHNDHLGSATVLSDSDGNFIEEKRYDPFGAELQGTSKIGYNSKELDKDTDLNYYGARYYASDFGRFTTADTVKGKLTNPQSLNLYAYTLNNPMKYVDPSGNVFEISNEIKDKKLRSNLQKAAKFYANFLEENYGGTNLAESPDVIKINVEREEGLGYGFGETFTTTTIGSFYINENGEGVITLNPDLVEGWDPGFSEESPWDDVGSTILHEMTHAMDRLAWNKRGKITTSDQDALRDITEINARIMQLKLLEKSSDFSDPETTKWYKEYMSKFQKRLVENMWFEGAVTASQKIVGENPHKIGPLPQYSTATEEKRKEIMSKYLNKK